MGSKKRRGFIGRAVALVAVALCLALTTPAQTGPAFTNSVRMEFVSVPAGSFQMGSDKNCENCSADETPRHRVAITRPFYLGKCEVTQGQWVEVMGSNPSLFKGRENPVEQVSSDDAQAFVRRLNAKEGTGLYRLPTEAEWEYACRANSGEKHPFGDDESALGQYAWYSVNSEDKTYPVGQLKPNKWGLYDMAGNVWEWCQDWYDESYYSRSPGADPQRASSGSFRVHRGGGWDDDARGCRPAHRCDGSPDDRSYDLGFRLARGQ